MLRQHAGRPTRCCTTVLVWLTSNRRYNVTHLCPFEVALFAVHVLTTRNTHIPSAQSQRHVNSLLISTVCFRPHWQMRYWCLSTRHSNAHFSNTWQVLYEAASCAQLFRNKQSVKKHSFSQRTIDVGNIYYLLIVCILVHNVNMSKNRIDKYLVKARYTYNNNGRLRIA